MRGQVFRAVAVVFAFFITAGITSCKMFSEAKSKASEKKIVNKTTTVNKIPVRTGISERDKALQAIQKEWSGRIKCGRVDGELCAVVDNNSTILSKKWTPVEAGKHYTLSGCFKSLGKSHSKIYYGFICYDKNKKQINTLDSNVILYSTTTLVKACKKGDKLLVLKSNKKWKKGNYAAVFNAKDDFSDIPNRDIAYRIIKVIPDGDNVEVQFSKAFSKAYPAGTRVRMHTSSYGSYVYTTVCGAAVPKLWKTYKGSATLAKPGQMGWQYLRPGTAFVRVVILPNYRKNKDEKLVFKNLELTVK